MEQTWWIKYTCRSWQTLHLICEKLLPFMSEHIMEKFFGQHSTGDKEYEQPHTMLIFSTLCSLFLMIGIVSKIQENSLTFTCVHKLWMWFPSFLRFESLSRTSIMGFPSWFHKIQIKVDQQRNKSNTFHVSRKERMYRLIACQVVDRNFCDLYFHWFNSYRSQYWMKQTHTKREHSRTCLSARSRYNCVALSMCNLVGALS